MFLGCGAGFHDGVDVGVNSAVAAVLLLVSAKFVVQLADAVAADVVDGEINAVFGMNPSTNKVSGIRIVSAAAVAAKGKLQQMIHRIFNFTTGIRLACAFFQ